MSNSEILVEALAEGHPQTLKALASKWGVDLPPRNVWFSEVLIMRLAKYARAQDVQTAPGTGWYNELTNVRSEDDE